jgi:hypothetical protein
MPLLERMTTPQLPDGWRMEKEAGSNWPLYMGPKGERQYWYPGELTNGYERRFKNVTRRALYTRNTPALLNGWNTKKNSTSGARYYKKGDLRQWHRPGELPPGWKYASDKKGSYINNKGIRRNNPPVGPKSRNNSPGSPVSLSLGNNSSVKGTATATSTATATGRAASVSGKGLDTLEKLEAWISSLCNCQNTMADIVSIDNPPNPSNISLQDNFFFIDNIYKEKDGTAKPRLAQIMHQGYKVKGYFKSGEYQGYIDQLQIKQLKITQNTGGGSNDCLIIAFLFGVSEAFRKASYPVKYKIASTFRRVYFSSLPEFGIVFKQGTSVPTYRNTYSVALAKVNGRENLDDEFAEVLKKQYNINILFLEGIKIGDSQGIEVLEPPKVTYLDQPGARTGIIVFNRGNYHFEGVYDNDAHTFIFPVEYIELLQMTVQNGSPFKYIEQMSEAEIAEQRRRNEEEAIAVAMRSFATKRGGRTRRQKKRR